MAEASLDARINAEAILKAACLRAATDLILAERVSVPDEVEIERSVATVAMSIWNVLEKPDKWPA